MSARSAHAPRWVNQRLAPRRGRRRRSRRSRARPRSSGGRRGSSVHQRSTTRHSSRTSDDAAAVHPARRPVEPLLDERRPRCVQSSRGTSSARCSGIRDHGATSTTVATAPAPALARTWRRPSFSRSSKLFALRPDELELLARRSRRARAARPQRETRARAARRASARAPPAAPPAPPSARAASACAATSRRRRAAPRARACGSARPPRSGRASIRSSSASSARRSVSSFPTASRELEPLGDLGRRRPRPDACVALAPRQAPGAPAVRPQSFGDGAARQPGKLSDLLARRAAPSSSRRSSLERQQRQRQRREELAACGRRRRPAPAPAGRRRGGERGEPPVGRAGARVPRGADRRERALERRRDAAVEPLDAARVEVEAARLDRLDREAVVLEPRGSRPPTPARPPAGSCSTSTSSGQVASASPSRMPGRTPARLGGGGHRPEQRLGPGQRRERRRAQPEPRPLAQRRLKLEPGDEDAGDHGNICSTRTYVLLSSGAIPSRERRPYFVAVSGWRNLFKGAEEGPVLPMLLAGGIMIVLLVILIVLTVVQKLV